MTKLLLCFDDKIYNFHVIIKLTEVDNRNFRIVHHETLYIIQEEYKTIGTLFAAAVLIPNIRHTISYKYRITWHVS